MTNSPLEPQRQNIPDERSRDNASANLSQTAYGPPLIEAVLTPDETQREVLYAGELTSPDLG